MGNLAIYLVIHKNIKKEKSKIFFKILCNFSRIFVIYIKDTKYVNGIARWKTFGKLSLNP